MTSADGKSYGMPFFIDGGQVFIQNTVIKNGSIDSLKIANTLQSNNFVSGKSGWRLDKNTGLEFATILPGGGRAVYDGYGMSMYDNNNVKRFGAGYKP